MNRKDKSTNELLLELGTVIQQVQVLLRGHKEHPGDEIFKQGIAFMKKEARDIMNVLTKRNYDEKTTKITNEE